MKSFTLGLCMAAVFAFAATLAQAQTCPVDPVTGNAVARLVSLTDGSFVPVAPAVNTLPLVDPVSGFAGAVTFEWCNANADYFLVVESVSGAHDIFNAFAGGVGPRAGVVSVTLGPACNVPTATSPTTQCIPANGETIHVTLSTLKGKALLGQIAQYTFTAATSTSNAALVASVLPASRSVQVGATATAFATVINTGSSPATGCRLSLGAGIPAGFSFQTTNSATNQVTGSPNTPVGIPGSAQQSFVFAVTPTAPLPPTDVPITFGCTNATAALVIPGVNTLLFSASATPVPDVVALAATLNNDGIVNIPGTSGTGVFSVATVNVGASGVITATADTGSASPPVSILLCQTNPITGACLATPSASATTTINTSETPTFGIFVTGAGTVPFDPANNRIFVRFKDAGGVTRGATSVAVRTQ
jgi:hypothetical protein